MLASKPSKITEYDHCVFINCPFDESYRPLIKPMIFAIIACGFIPRCALEEDNSGIVRASKIVKFIKESRLGIHDISRAELDPNTNLPRFNMPFELGLFLGAMHFGSGKQKNKSCKIIDIEKYRYRNGLSDIAGQDIAAHENKPDKIITIVSNWLRSEDGGNFDIPTANEIIELYKKFNEDYDNTFKHLPKWKSAFEDFLYLDYRNIAAHWLRSKINKS